MWHIHYLATQRLFENQVFCKTWIVVLIPLASSNSTLSIAFEDSLQVNHWRITGDILKFVLEDFLQPTHCDWLGKTFIIKLR